AVPLAGRPLLHDQVGTRAIRRPEHGPVVPYSRARELPVGSSVERLRRPASGDATGTLFDTLLVDRRGRDRDAADHTAGKAPDGRGALTSDAERPTAESQGRLGTNPNAPARRLLVVSMLLPGMPGGDAHDCPHESSSQR